MIVTKMGNIILKRKKFATAEQLAALEAKRQRLQAAGMNTSALDSRISTLKGQVGTMTSPNRVMVSGGAGSNAVTGVAMGSNGIGPTTEQIQNVGKTVDSASKTKGVINSTKSLWKSGAMGKAKIIGGTGALIGAGMLAGKMLGGSSDKPEQRGYSEGTTFHIKRIS